MKKKDNTALEQFDCKVINSLCTLKVKTNLAHVSEGKKSAGWGIGVELMYLNLQEELHGE